MWRYCTVYTHRYSSYPVRLFMICMCHQLQYAILQKYNILKATAKYIKLQPCAQKTHIILNDHFFRSLILMEQRPRWLIRTAFNTYMQSCLNLPTIRQSTTTTTCGLTFNIILTCTYCMPCIHTRLSAIYS